MSFMSNHVIHVKSCYLCQIMTFMSNHVMHVKSCHSCQIISFMSWVIGLFRKFTKVGREGGRGEGGQICLPRPLATASLSGRRRKCSCGLLVGSKFCPAALFLMPFWLALYCTVAARAAVAHELSVITLNSRALNIPLTIGRRCMPPLAAQQM
jgi:hypothetical protein